MSIVDDLGLFPVLVRQVKGFLTSSECGEIVSGLRSERFGRHSVLDGDAVSTFHSGLEESRFAVDEIERFVEIKDKLLREINLYARDFGTRPIGLSNSWINVQRENSLLHYHTHPTSVISGALYLKVDDRSSSISFQNPNPFIAVTEVLNWTSYTVKTASIKPAQGSLLLFPSWLTHGAVDRNMSEQRIVLSFNTAFDSRSPASGGD